MKDRYFLHASNGNAGSKIATVQFSECKFEQYYDRRPKGRIC